MILNMAILVILLEPHMSTMNSVVCLAERYVLEGLASSGNKCYGSELRLGCVLVEWILTVR